jgi:hypothetical protein
LRRQATLAGSQRLDEVGPSLVGAEGGGPGTTICSCEQALREFRTTRADFSDAQIGRINRALGADQTVTFDRNLEDLDSFRVP